MKAAQTFSSWFTFRRLGLLAFVLMISAILAYKFYDEGWFLPRIPLVLNDRPAVLFFNRHKGCECVLVVYNAAARQMREWPDEKFRDVQLIIIDLDRRPDLGNQFNIVRAPTLLVLDAEGNTVYRQDEVVTDLEPLDLSLLEEKIEALIKEKALD